MSPPKFDTLLASWYLTCAKFHNQPFIMRRVLDDWTDVIEHGENVDAISSLDYAKAFDTVPHKRLLAKLSGYGIGGKLLKWIAAFLEERRRRVIVNGSKSSWTRVTSSVPCSVMCFLLPLPLGAVIVFTGTSGAL